MADDEWVPASAVLAPEQPPERGYLRTATDHLGRSIDFGLGQPRAPSAETVTLPEGAPAPPISARQELQPMGGGKDVDTFIERSYLGSILHHFGQGFSDDWGAAKFGPDMKKFLTEKGILYDPAQGPPTIAKAFNEAFVRPAVNMLDASVRTLSATPKALGEALRAAGVPRELVHMTLENPLWRGAPGGLGPGRLPERVISGADTVIVPLARDLDVIGPPRAPLTEGTAAEAATAAVRPQIAPADAALRDKLAKLEDQGRELNAREDTLLGTPETAERATELQDISGQRRALQDEWNTTHDQATSVAARTGDDVVRSERPGVPQAATDKAGNIRLDLINTHEDAKTLIRRAAEENDGFMPARSGEIAPAHAGALSEVLGIPVEQLDKVGMGRTLQNDNMVRWAIQAMIQSAEELAGKMKAAALTDNLENLTAFQESWMRHSILQEHVAGLTAEWGRTGNVFQEFRERVKTAQDLGQWLKDKKAGSIDDLREMVKHGAALDPRTELPRFMQEMRKPTFMDKMLWYWTNSLLSGPVTHLKYIAANAAYLAHDTLLAKPLAGLAGAARQLVGKEQIERAYMGEAAAQMYGLIAGVPDAIRAAGEAVRNNIPTPLPPQLKGAGRQSPVTGLNPVGGVVGTVVGAPSNVISGIHSFFNFLGYRGELEAQAYRKVASQGHSPFTNEFWQYQKELRNFPDDAMMDAAIEAGSRANFVQDLGPVGRKLQATLYESKIGRFVMPFIKVPGNIVNAMQEGTVFAYLDARFRDNLNGKNGGVARDTAMGRLMAGSAVMGWAAYETLNDRVTGHGPLDEKQRAEWLLTHQPRSIRIGGKWRSYDRFGPIGGWFSLAADLTDAGQAIHAGLNKDRMTPTEIAKADKDIQEAIGRVAVGFAHWLEEAGFQGLFEMVNAMHHDGQSGHHVQKYAGTIAGTFLPYSTMLTQTAAQMDPNMRETKTFVDALKFRIPVLRESLYPARDWSGVPRINASSMSLVRVQEINNDPVDLEMQRLDLKPTRVQDSIKGIKLTPGQYDEYQTVAGTLTRMQLNALVTQPTWPSDQDSAYMRSKIIEKTISTARAQATAYMQGRYPELMMEGIGQRMMELRGAKPRSGAFQRPE